MTQPTIVTGSPATSLEKIDRNLSSVFDVTPIQAATPVVASTVMPVDDNAPQNEQVEADANFARSNIYGLVESGKEAVQYALDLAKQSDNPRAFEVVGNLLKNLADINMQLLDVQDKKSKLKPKKEQEESGPAKVVNNNSIVFNGTTAQLNEMLRNMKKESQ